MPTLAECIKALEKVEEELARSRRRIERLKERLKKLEVPPHT